MNILDILITIIVVTILVTIVLGVVTYIAYKLRLARRPDSPRDETDGAWYFERHAPAGKADGAS
jgi:heme/copper-type cytochrome/quinol oxidase subunit 2